MLLLDVLEASLDLAAHGAESVGGGHVQGLLGYPGLRGREEGDGGGGGRRDERRGGGRMREGKGGRGRMREGREGKGGRGGKEGG